MWSRPIKYDNTSVQAGLIREASAIGVIAIESAHAQHPLFSAAAHGKRSPTSTLEETDEIAYFDRGSSSHG
jgi:hypothetical protein